MTNEVSARTLTSLVLAPLCRTMIRRISWRPRACVGCAQKTVIAAKPKQLKNARLTVPCGARIVVTSSKQILSLLKQVLPSAAESGRHFSVGRHGCQAKG